VQRRAAPTPKAKERPASKGRVHKARFSEVCWEGR
jgi:hypothetical protein